MTTDRTKYTYIIICMALVFVAGRQTKTMADTSSGLDSKYADRLASLPDSLVNFAQNYLKTPYRYGSVGIKTFDCSGFSGFVFRNFGYNLSRSAAGQANDEGVEIDRTELQPGDLVFFKGRNTKRKKAGHVGIVVEADGKGDFKFIHASVYKGVTITDSRTAYYRTRYISAKRVLKKNLPNIAVEPIEVVIPSLVVH